MNILFVQTGGTIDKDYPRKSGGYAFEFGEPATERILGRMDLSFAYEILCAFQKDSLDITEKDRQKLSDLIQQRPEDKIVITHGTDTLLETAHFLSNHHVNKYIVLTGAMRPERFSNSDAQLNLGMAIAAVQLHQTGIYVCMHGIIKPHNEINRNKKTGFFH